MFRSTLAFLGTLFLPALALPSITLAADPQQPAVFAHTVCRDMMLHHLVALPAHYADDPDVRWPLVLFLHGSGERGNELERVKVNGLPRELAAGREVPAVVLSPQCPADARWDTELMVAALHALLDDAMTRFRIDPDRVYVTGLSMGGAGTWAVAAADPGRFAAIAPVCGAVDPALAVRLRRVPVWAFHGAQDDIVPVAATQGMAEAMVRAHGIMRTTIYPDAGHDSWSATYSDPAFYGWLFAQRRSAPTLASTANAVVTASSGDAAKATDGDPGTRWESAWSDPQWWQLDLGGPRPLRRLVIIWETAYTKTYEVRASRGDGQWQTVATVVAGDGGVDVIELPPGFAASVVRLDLTERGTQWGHSIWEVEWEE